MLWAWSGCSGLLGESCLFVALVMGRKMCLCCSACNTKGTSELDQTSSGWFGITAHVGASLQGQCGALSAMFLHVALRALTNIPVLCSPLLGRKTSLSREMRWRVPRCPPAEPGAGSGGLAAVPWVTAVAGDVILLRSKQ